MSFDRNADHRISLEELPERMQTLVARGDKNADAVLDVDEFRPLFISALQAQVRGAIGVPQRHTEPPERLAGVIQDLMLPPQKHAVAFGIASRPNLQLTSDVINQELTREW